MINKTERSIFDSIEEKAQEIGSTNVRAAFDYQIRVDVSAAVDKAWKQFASNEIFVALDRVVEYVSVAAIETLFTRIPELSSDGARAKKAREYIVRCVSVSAQAFKAEATMRQFDGIHVSLRQMVSEIIGKVAAEAAVQSAFGSKLLTPKEK